MTKKRKVRCVHCGSLHTQRNGIRKIKVRYVQRFWCLACKRSFCLRKEPRSRVSYSEKVKLTRLHLEGGTSIRTLSRHHAHSTRTVMNAIHDVTANVATATQVAEILKPEWDGWLGIDGKSIKVWDWFGKNYAHLSKPERRWLHKMCLIGTLDLGTGDIPVHHLGDEETVIDLTMCLEQLRASGYPLKGYVSDGNPDIARVMSRMFGKHIPHQLCRTHYIEGLKVKLRKEIITPLQYEEAKYSLLRGEKPDLLVVPNELFTYQKYKELPPTNQDIEVLNRFLNLRLKTINQFRHVKYATSYLDALVLYRRFKPYTDKKKPNTHLNGLAPLEIAGCNLKDIDYLYSNLHQEH